MNDLTAFSRRIAGRYRTDGGGQAVFSPGGCIKLLHKKTAGSFSSSLSVRNEIAVNIRLSLGGHNKMVYGFTGYIPLSSHINTDYEYYLQKTMIRNIYGMYGRLAENTAKLTSALTMLSKPLSSERAHGVPELETRRLLRRFAEYTGVMYSEMPHPRVLFDVRRGAPVTERHTHTENRIKQTVEADFRSVPGASIEAAGRIGVKAAAEQVYKRLSEDLRRERLKKGY